MKKIAALCALLLTTFVATGQVTKTTQGVVTTTAGKTVAVRFSSDNVSVAPDGQSLIISPEINADCFISVQGVTPTIEIDESDGMWITIGELSVGSGLIPNEKVAIINSSLPKQLPSGKNYREAMLFLSADNAIHVIQRPSGTTDGSQAADNFYKLTEKLGQGSICNTLFGFKNSGGEFKVIDDELFTAGQLKYSMMVSVNSKRFPYDYVMVSPFVDQLTYPYTKQERAVFHYYWGNTSKCYVVAQPGQLAPDSREAMAKDIMDHFVSKFIKYGDGERDRKATISQIPDHIKEYKICDSIYKQRLANSTGLSLLEKYFIKHSPTVTQLEFLGDKNATHYSMEFNFHDEILRAYCFFFTPVTFRYELYSFYNQPTNTTAWVTFISVGYDIEALKKVEMGRSTMYGFYSDYAANEVAKKLAGFTLDGYALKGNVTDFEKNFLFFAHNITGEPASDSLRIITPPAFGVGNH